MVIPRTLIAWTTALLPVAAVAPYSGGYMAVFACLCTALVGMAALDAVISRRRLSQVSVSSAGVCRLTLGKMGKVQVRLANGGEHRARFRLLPVLPPDVESGPDEASRQVVAVGAGEAVALDVSCQPIRRGSFAFECCALEAVSVLGLWNVRRHCGVNGELRVYPDISRERKTLGALLLNRSFIGERLCRTQGQGREFEKLRDYIHGDSYNILSWKATAKKGKPVSKVFQVERAREIYAIIDTGRLSAVRRQGVEVLERYLATVLVLSLVASRHGDLFGVVAFDEEVRAFVKAGSGNARRMACREAVFSLMARPVSPNYPALFTFLKLNARRRTLLLFLTDLGEAALAESFVSNVKILSARHLCVVAGIRGEEAAPLFEGPPLADAGQLHARLAGHLKWADLHGVGESLARIGVRFDTAEPERFCREVVHSYLDVKGRQLL